MSVHHKPKWIDTWWPIFPITLALLGIFTIALFHPVQ
jgi:hypothetical protein